MIVTVLLLGLRAAAKPERDLTQLGLPGPIFLWSGEFFDTTQHLNLLPKPFESALSAESRSQRDRCYSHWRYSYFRRGISTQSHTATERPNVSQAVLLSQSKDSDGFLKAS